MHNLIVKLYKAYRIASRTIVSGLCKWRCRLVFWLNKVQCKSFYTQGMPFVHVSLGATCTIGERFRMNNGVRYADSGTNGRCRIEVRDQAVLSIGNDVGMSDVTITCHTGISIGNNVLLGVGTQVRDTDNHSLNPADRLNGKDWLNKKNSPVRIGDHVFIGTNVLILKGVTIGENAIIGAGSVVTKNIPANEIWAGNPAKFVKAVGTVS